MTIVCDLEEREEGVGKGAIREEEDTIRGGQRGKRSLSRHLRVGQEGEEGDVGVCPGVEHRMRWQGKGGEEGQDLGTGRE